MVFEALPFLLFPIKQRYIVGIASNGTISHIKSLPILVGLPAAMRGRSLAQVSIKLLLIIPETQGFGRVPFSPSLNGSVGLRIRGSVPP